MDDYYSMSNGDQKKRGLTFSRDINAGHLLTAIMIALGMVAGYAAFYARMNIIEYKQVETDKVIIELRASNMSMNQAIVELKANNNVLTIIQQQMQKQLERKTQ